MGLRDSRGGGMFKFGKKKGAADGDDANLPAVADGESVDGDAAPKKKVPLLFIIVPAALVLLGGGGGAAFFLMQPKAAAADDGHAPAPSSHAAPKKKSGGGHGGGSGEANPALGVIAEGPDGVVFFTLPDMTVNIQGTGGRPT